MSPHDILTHPMVIMLGVFVAFLFIGIGAETPPSEPGDRNQ